MTVHYQKCDHCGKKLNDMEDYIEVDIDLGAKTYCADICKECMKELEKTVGIFIGLEVQDDPR